MSRSFPRSLESICCGLRNLRERDTSTNDYLMQAIVTSSCASKMCCVIFMWLAMTERERETLFYEGDS